MKDKKSKNKVCSAIKADNIEDGSSRNNNDDDPVDEVTLLSAEGSSPEDGNRDLEQ